MRTALLTLFTAAVAIADEAVISSFAESTSAPHGHGNVYAPDIVRHGGKLLMFFGGQGRDGHDRIHLATSSDDGKTWQQQGVVFAPEGVNHANDPSVVVEKGLLHLFYTRAANGVTDSIGHAVSDDGLKWTDDGAVFGPAAARAWDSLLVGRPSVIHDGKHFRMWYDGRKDLPTGAPDPVAPQSANSRRFAGHATSPDGRTWTRHPAAVFGEDAGGIHVVRHGAAFLMVFESREGTRWAASGDGLSWEAKGLLRAKGPGAESRHGHVTPFLLPAGDAVRLYYGAAAAESWDRNSIRAVDVAIPPLSKQ